MLSIFFSIMFREARDDLPDGIYIRFRTDGSLFNLWGLLARTKTIEELILSCCLLTTASFLPTQRKPYSTLVNRFSDAAKNFGLTISLKKTEVLYQPLHVRHTALLTSASMAPT